MTAVDAGDGVKIATAGMTSTVAPLAAFDGQKSVISMDGMNGAAYTERFSSGQREGTWGVMSQPSGSAFYSEFHGRESTVGGGMLDGMCLPDHFLRQYYSQVRIKLYFYSSFCKLKTALCHE